jgi:hypothetical protein
MDHCIVQPHAGEVVGALLEYALKEDKESKSLPLGQDSRAHALSWGL